MIYRQSAPSPSINGRVVCSGHEFEPINIREEQCTICDTVRQRQDVIGDAERGIYRRPPPSHIIVNGRVACIMHDFIPLTIRQERCHVCGSVRQRQDVVDEAEAATYRPPPSHTFINGRIVCFMHDYVLLNASEDRCCVCGTVRQREEPVGS